MRAKEIQSLYKGELGKDAAYCLTRAPEAEPFWQGCKEGRLMLPRCRNCRRFHFYPRSFCPHCDGRELEWCAASGDGSIYSFAVVCQPLEKPFASLVPYVIVIVELDEGVRILSHLTGTDPEGVSCGMRVRAEFATTPVGVFAPIFRPA